MLLEFPPPKEKAAHGKNTGTAEEIKLPHHNNETEALMQGLDNVKMYGEAVFENLIARACFKYLNEGSPS